MGIYDVDFSSFKVFKSRISELKKIPFLRAHLIPTWNRDHAPACEKDIPGLDIPCSARPRDISAEMDVTLQRPADNFRYNKSHVQRHLVPLLQLYSEFGTHSQYLGELHAVTVGAPGQLLCPQAPRARPGGAAFS